MILLPAVDIRDGRAVRLQQGDFARETVYGEDPVEAARDFGVAGARALHVVDLDGARDGEPANLGHAERIVRELGLPVQYGGGLRSLHSDQPRAGRGCRASDPRHGRAHRPRVSRPGRWLTSPTRSPSAWTCGRAAWP